MNINVKLSLDTRDAKKDGTYPIIMRITRYDKTVRLATDYCVHEKDWDSKRREVKKSYVGLQSATRINNQLGAQKKEAWDIILKLDEAGKLDAMSLAEVKTRLIRKTASVSFIEFAHDEIDALNRAKRFGTARWYECTLCVIKDLINGKDRTQNTGKSKGYGRHEYKGKDLKFEEVNYRFLKKFETEHYKDGNTANGLSFYMRGIRAIYNKGIMAGFVDRKHYPFDDYKIRTQQTQKRALDWDLFRKIIALKLDSNHELFDARNFFVASYMMYGMSFSDMAYLEKTDFTDGRIHYRRRKTGKLYDIKVTPLLDELLSHYLTCYPESRFLFPILDEEEAYRQDKKVQWARKRFNRKLKDLGEVCGIEQSLTSYVSRHTFATQAMLQEVPLAAISSMLGHSSLKTTEAYLKSLPSNILDDYNARIMDRQV